MQLTGQQVIAAPRANIWRVLTEPKILRRIHTACQLTERGAEDRITLHIGPTKASPVGWFRLSAFRPWSSRSTVADRISYATAHFEGTLTIELADQGADTLLNYAFDPFPVPQLAEFPPQMMRAITITQATHFLSRLEHAVARRLRTVVAAGCGYIDVQIVEVLPQPGVPAWRAENTQQLMLLAAMGVLSMCLLLFSYLR